MQQTAIFVLGMDRTGTSAITGLLNIFGLPVGEDSIPTQKDNPKGFFEQNDILHLNEEILLSFGESSWWYEKFPKIDSCGGENKKYIEKIKYLIKNKFQFEKIFLIKDPRIAFIFPLYKKACEELNIQIKVIVTLRPYNEIAQSLLLRNEMPFDSAYRGIVERYSKILDYTQGLARITVNYYETVDETERLFGRLQKFIPTLKIDSDTKKTGLEFITKDLRHNISSPNTRIQFLGIGAQKSGTTTLWGILKQHPEIQISNEKEVHYFDYPEHFIIGDKWYEEQIFQTFNPDKLTGEITPYYLFHPNVPRKVFHFNPHMKILVILRDPVMRAWSHYWHTINLQEENLSFEDALVQEDSRLGTSEERLQEDFLLYEKAHQTYSYRHRGYYHNQLEHWLEFFNRSQLCCIRFEDFVMNPKEEMGKIFSFLGVDNYDFEMPHLNRGQKVKKIPFWTKVILEAHFSPLNNNLDQDFSITWKYGFLSKLLGLFCKYRKIDPLNLLAKGLLH